MEQGKIERGNGDPEQAIHTNKAHFHMRTLFIIENC